MAHAQWNQWKAPIPQPSCNASVCFNWSSTPMRSAPGGSHPALQGPASMEGWWQADCARYSYLPGGQGGGRGPLPRRLPIQSGVDLGGLLPPELLTSEPDREP